MLKKIKRVFKRKVLVVLSTLVVLSFLFILSSCSYDMSSITFSDETVTYDGESHSIEISGTLPDGVSVSYVGNDQTEVGVYNVTASFTGDSFYSSITSLTATLTISEGTINDVSFSDETYTYDEEYHTLLVSGLTDTNRFTVTYQNNSKKSVGVYNALAIVTDTEGEYETKYLTATLTIEVATSVDIEFNDEYVLYDGNTHSITATGLPLGVTATYTYNDDDTVEGESEIGTYVITATFTDSLGNYEIEDMTATLYIQDSTLSDVSFVDETYTYDEESHSLEITGDLPDNVEVTYTYNGDDVSEVSDAGTYEVVASFTVEDNLYVIEDMTATLTIEQADITEIVNFDDLYFNIDTDSDTTEATMTYTLDDYTIELPYGVNVEYSDNYIESDAGVYTVTATFTDSNGNYATTTLEALMTVVLDEDDTDSYTVTADTNSLTASISKYVGSDTEITIPYYVVEDGIAYRVTEVASKTFSNASITSIEFNDNIVSIGEKCCYNCTSLVSLVLPDNDEFSEIPSNSFYNCALTSLDLPTNIDTIGSYAFYGNEVLELDLSNVTTIGSYAFAYSISLKTVTLSNDLEEIPDYCFYSSSILATLNSDTTGTCDLPNSVTYVGEYAFGTDSISYINSSMNTLITNDNLIEIADYAFAYNTGFTSVTFNSNLETIGNYAFLCKSAYYSNSITALSIPASVSSVGDYAFQYSTNLTTLEFSGNGTSVGDYAFAYDLNLETVTTIDSSATNEVTIGQYAFTNNSVSTYMALTTVVLSDNVTSIGSYAFYYDQYLTTITTTSKANTTINSTDNNYMPESLEYISYSAFNTCNLLDGDIYFYDDLKLVESYAFYDCDALDNVYFGGGLYDSLATTSIEYSAFYDCDSLTAASLYGVSSISRYAFYDCDVLESLYFNTQISMIGYYSFYDTNLSSLYIYSILNTDLTSSIYFCVYDDSGIVSTSDNLTVDYLNSGFVCIKV